jgi:hypothetical protein
MFRIVINTLFESLFARVLASHRGGPGSTPVRDMSVVSLNDFKKFSGLLEKAAIFGVLGPLV